MTGVICCNSLNLIIFRIRIAQSNILEQDICIYQNSAKYFYLLFLEDVAIFLCYEM